jgi:hypothetical protein
MPYIKKDRLGRNALLEYTSLEDRAKDNWIAKLYKELYDSTEYYVGDVPIDSPLICLDIYEWWGATDNNDVINNNTKMEYLQACNYRQLWEDMSYKIFKILDSTSGYKISNKIVDKLNEKLNQDGNANKWIFKRGRVSENYRTHEKTVSIFIDYNDSDDYID